MARLDPADGTKATSGMHHKGEDHAASLRGSLRLVLEEAARIWDINRELLALALYWAGGWLC
jgi:hypothetical protein